MRFILSIRVLEGFFKVFEDTSMVTVWVTADIVTPFKYFMIPLMVDFGRNM
jgi:hypothetical protein